MKPFILLTFCAAAACAQQAAPTASAPWQKLPDTEVIAVIDGQPLTVGQLKIYFEFIPPEGQQALTANPELVLRRIYGMKKLAAMAVEQKLDQASPLREQLEYNRNAVLAQAGAEYLVKSPTVDSNEILNYYNANKESFKQVKVKAIEVAFGSAPAAKGGPKILTEEEAKAKALKLLAAIRGGADFVKLVRENSDDETTKAHDGDFPNAFKPSDSIPDGMRAVVFQLKKGETSEPIRQANGFYLLRAEDVTYQALSQVRDQIFGKIKEGKGEALLMKLDSETKIEFPNPAFPGKPAAPAPAK